MRLPQPSRWRKPSTWILPLLGVLALLAVIVARMPRDEAFPPSDGRLPTIVLDAGHGGHDSGATENGLVEKMLTLDTALRVERRLKQKGYPVVMTRRDDRFLELYDRSQVANALPNALFVSIHFNDNTSQSGDGVETYYAERKVGWVPSLTGGAGGTSPCSALAQAVQSAMVKGLAATDRGVRARQLAVVRYARCPAILVEGGFINNPAEARKIAIPQYRDVLADSIVAGIVEFQIQRTKVARDSRVAGR